MDTGLIDRGEAATLPPESEAREAMVAFAAVAERRAALAPRTTIRGSTLVGFRLNGPAPLKLEVRPARAATRCTSRSPAPPVRSR